MTLFLSFLFVVLVIQQILDIYTTHKVLSQGGRELNPLLDKLMDRIGVLPALVLTKLIVIVSFGFVLFNNPVVSISALLVSVLIGFYSWVLVNNFKAIK